MLGWHGMDAGECVDAGVGEGESEGVVWARVIVSYRVFLEAFETPCPNDVSVSEIRITA